MIDKLYESLTPKQVNELILFLWGEKPKKNMNKNYQTLAETLIGRKYEGELSVEAIKQDDENRDEMIMKERIEIERLSSDPEYVKHAVKLDSNFDPYATKEATKFIATHGYKEILDQSVTTLPCIMLTNDESITNDLRFLSLIQGQMSYSNNYENVKDRGLYQEYYINRLTKIQKVYEQLDKIYVSNKQAFKILVDFGFVSQIKDAENPQKFTYKITPPKEEKTNLSIPHTITNKSDIESYKHYIASNISEKMERHHENSNTRYVAIVTSL
jgi:hypothetical protein